MSEATTVLGKRVPNDQFIHLVARHLRDRAELAREAIGGPYDSNSAPRHVAALEALSDYLVGLSPDDQRVYALFLLRSFHGDTDKWEPGEDAQVRFLTALGDTPHIPQPNELLNEFVGAGIADLSELFGQQKKKLAGAQAAAADHDKTKGELATARERITSLESQLKGANRAAQDFERQRDYLRDRQPDDASSEPAGSDSASHSGDGGLARDESEQKEKTLA